MRKPLILSLALLTIGGALAQSGSLLGDFTLTSPGSDLVATRKNGTFEGTLAGPSVTLKSAFLELSAKKIWARASPQGEKKAVRLTRATASGGVRIVRRDAKSGQSDVVTCERAELTAGAAPASGHIDLTGRVVWKTFDKKQGLLQQLAGEGGSIDFDESGETIRLKNLEATVAAPKEKGKS